MTDTIHVSAGCSSSLPLVIKAMKGGITPPPSIFSFLDFHVERLPITLLFTSTTDGMEGPLSYPSLRQKMEGWSVLTRQDEDLIFYAVFFNEAPTAQEIALILDGMEAISFRIARPRLVVHKPHINTYDGPAPYECAGPVA